MLKECTVKDIRRVTPRRNDFLTMRKFYFMPKTLMVLATPKLHTLGIDEIKWSVSSCGICNQAMVDEF